MSSNNQSSGNLVSVVIPTYNHARFIGEAIQSVIDQTYENWECIVVNNFSEDNTAEVMESFGDSRIRLINFRNNGVIAASRNQGVKESNGNYIAFLDSDDIWFKNKLEKQISKFDNREDILVVATNLVRFPEEKVKGLLAFRQGRFNLLRDKTITFKYMLNRSIICNSSVMVKKKIFDEIGYLDEKIELRAVEDYDFWLKILDYRDRSICILKEVLVSYRLHGSSVGRNDTQQIQNNKISIIFDKYKNKYPLLIDKAKKRRSL